MLIAVVLLLGSNQLQAQSSTWDQVYNILSSKCYGSGCHQPGSNPSFDVTDSKASLYNQLVNVFPVNPYVKDSLKYYLVEPGHPDRSFLFRKVAHSLGTFRRDNVILSIAEGADMPASGRPELTKTEVEVIRQWILAGADSTSQYPTADTAVIADFYNGNARPMIQAPTPPPAGQGFQIHYGPVFYPPHTEREYFMKDSLKLPDDIEVTALELYMNDEAHHYILRKYNTPQNWDEGLSPLDPLTAFDSDKDYVIGWQNDETINLPAGAAYYWPKNIVLDHDYHMLNPHNEVLAAEAFLNIYTEPKGTAQHEMKSALINNTDLFIPNDGQEVTITESANFSNISVWTLSSHTHLNGTSFMIWLKGINGASDSLVYNGMIDYTTGINVGYFDYEHPPNRFFDNFMTSLYDTMPNGDKKYSGFKYEAKYVNNGPRSQTFGFTTEDEMMIFYVQYIDGNYRITGINDATQMLQGTNISVFPNPLSSTSQLSFTLVDPGTATATVTDVLGKKLAVLFENEQLQPGSHTYSMSQLHLNTGGIYFVTLTVNGASATTKFVVTEQ